MKFIKKFERFISEKLGDTEATMVKSRPKSKPRLKTATAEEVAEKFMSLLKQAGDDVKKYIEK